MALSNVHSGMPATTIDAHLSRGERDPAPGAYPEGHRGEDGPQARDEVPEGKPFLPTPDSRLAFGGALNDPHRTEPLGSGQHDTGAPDVLLRAAAVRRDSFEPVTLATVL
jgi:hypothetical protein